MKTDLSILIPCFNEEGTIYSCLDRVSGIKLSGEIIVVDDGSEDKTPQIVQEKIKGFNIPMKLIRLRKNYGKARAVRYGVDVAKGEVIIIHDADMIIYPEILERFYYLIKNNHADIVIGSRFIYPYERGAIRKISLIANKLLALTLSFLMKQKITDALCGLKAFRKEDFLKMGHGECRWGDLDILIGSRKMGLRIAEVSVRYFKRRSGISKMRPFYDTYLFAKQTVRAFYELKIKSILA